MITDKNKKLIHEIFDEIKNRTSPEDRVNILKFNDTWQLRQVLVGTFHPNVQFVIDKVPYYKPSDAPVGMGYTTIANELKRAYVFERGNPKVNPNLSQKRKELLLAQILESLEAKEAEVFVNMLLKDQRVPGLTYDIVKEAFPDLLP